MKKLFAALAALILLLAPLCGCAGRAAPSPEEVSGALSSPFSADVSVTCRGSEYSGVLTRRADGIDVKMEAPAIFRGMLISFSGGEAAVSYHGLSFSLPSDKLPAASVIGAVVSVLDGELDPDGLSVQPAKDGSGALLITGDGFVLSAAPSDALGGALAPTRLEVPSEELVAIFENVAPAE